MQHGDPHGAGPHDAHDAHAEGHGRVPRSVADTFIIPLAIPIACVLGGAAIVFLLLAGPAREHRCGSPDRPRRGDLRASGSRVLRERALDKAGSGCGRRGRAGGHPGRCRACQRLLQP